MRRTGANRRISIRECTRAKYIAAIVNIEGVDHIDRMDRVLVRAEDDRGVDARVTGKGVFAVTIEHSALNILVHSVNVGWRGRGWKECQRCH